MKDFVLRTEYEPNWTLGMPWKSVIDLLEQKQEKEPEHFPQKKPQLKHELQMRKYL